MVCFPSPEKVVLKKISQLAALANVGTGDSNLARAGKATQVIGDFANDGEIVVNVPGMVRTLSGRDEIHDLVMAGFVSVTSLKVQFLDATARIGADPAHRDGQLHRARQRRQRQGHGNPGIAFQLEDQGELADHPGGNGQDAAISPPPTHHPGQPLAPIVFKALRVAGGMQPPAIVPKHSRSSPWESPR